MSAGFCDFADQLTQLNQQCLYRRRRVIDGPQGILLQVDGKQVVNFCSNDYLGLANHPEVVAGLNRRPISMASVAVPRI